MLIIWNRYGQGGALAKIYEREGKPVIVAENGYIGTDENEHHYFSLALNHHNGTGDFPIGPYSRWTDFNIPLNDWVQVRGRDLLLLPQRGIGPPGVAMPKNWTEQTKGRMQAQKRYVRVRKHPGTTKNGQPLEHALKDVHMCVTWGSGAGVKSIVAGVPVYYELPGWIGAAAATRDINKPYLGDRSVMLTRLAWAQWRISEIETGEPLDNLFIHGGFKTCV